MLQSAEHGADCRSLAPIPDLAHLLPAEFNDAVISGIPN